jgi:23S rRNA (pseudouridine1915-N3)-methyltransferase
LKIRIATVGKLKENYFSTAEKEYLKRLSRFTNISVAEISEERLTQEGATLIAQAVREEGNRLLQSAKGFDFKIALSPEGIKIDSLHFARKLEEVAINGLSSICFFIGGSYGLSQEVKEQCNEIVSFSDMTFAHQLFRIMLLEQIYRAFKINANETYHK